MVAALYLLIPLVLLAALLLRRYPGEGQLLALGARPDPRRVARSASRGPRPGRPALSSPRGGLLMARSMAVRPPPSPSVGTC